MKVVNPDLGGYLSTRPLHRTNGVRCLRRHTAHDAVPDETQGTWDPTVITVKSREPKVVHQKNVPDDPPVPRPPVY